MLENVMTENKAMKLGMLENVTTKSKAIRLGNVKL
jgi:hypothetical protein